MNEFNNLPTPIKIGAGSLGVITIGGATFMLPPGALLWFFGVLLVLLVLFLGGWLLWRSIMRRRRNASISGGLVDDGRATPKGISDPAKRAKLDDLRKKFLTGVNEYRSRGKDLYKLPWYVICGPPGAGKTEAIRRCNVGFPPGMQDGLQGVGGTINMNWWFTNHAVILDTAGKLMFEEVSPGETSEWREFLTLLKKSRPNCPINGLFLAISVEDLIKDSAEKILQKAGKIAQQLDVIQRVLDVRFPVYVIVTKCDLLTGFREFFDDITDPQLQHQMVGWSNPEPLDTSFRAELVDQHLKSVSQRLRQRRLGLLRDPVPESSDRRRTDEVDAMFALPNSLTAIGPRLRRYLETIFVAGEWSAKPLFLRGIYFTSSMREGSALDEELASAIGVPVGELPAGRGWERERSYFLRDLFMEKVFKERGLVTRATNTGQMLRRRRAVLYGTGFLFIVLFGLFAFLGQRSFRKSIGNQSDYWIAAGQPRPIVQGATDLSRNNMVVKVAGKDLNLGMTQARFHEELRQLASTNINYGVFRPIPHWISGGDVIGPDAMRQAQAAVFERDVIKPLISETWQKLGASDANLAKEDSDRESAALKRLLEIQTQLETSRIGSIATNSVTGFLTPLMTYVAGRDWVLETNLTGVMHWVYATGGRKDGWPPVWLTNTQSGYLMTNAYGRLLGRIKTQATKVRDGDQAFEELLKSFDDLQREERKLPSIISSAAAGTDPESAFKTYRDKLASWGSMLARARTNLMRDGAGASDNYTLVVQENLAKGTGYLAQAENILPTQPGPTSRSLRAMLDAAKEDLKKQTAQKSDELKPRLAELDRRALAPVSNSTRLLYQARADVCRAISGLTEQAKAGGKFASFPEWQKTAADRHQQLERARVETDLFQAASNYLERTTRQVAQEALADYVRDMQSRVLEGLRFPMLRSTGPVGEVMSISQISDKRMALQKIESELGTPAFASLLARQEGVSLNGLTNTLHELRSLAAALVGTEGVRPSCRIMLVHRPGDEGPDRWRLTAKYLYFPAGDSNEGIRFEEKDWSSPELNLDKPLAFNFYKQQQRVEPLPDLTVQHGDWGPLRMLHEGQSDRTLSDAKRRVTHVLKPDLSGERSMIFELNFTNARLPSLDRWPTMESVTSGLSLGKKP